MLTNICNQCTKCHLHVIVRFLTCVYQPRLIHALELLLWLFMFRSRPLFHFIRFLIWKILVQTSSSLRRVISFFCGYTLWRLFLRLFFLIFVLSVCYRKACVQTSTSIHRVMSLVLRHIQWLGVSVSAWKQGQRIVNGWQPTSNDINGYWKASEIMPKYGRFETWIPRAQLSV